MPTDTNIGRLKGWHGTRAPLARGGDSRTVTVTFAYNGELRTLVAPSRRAAFDKARIAWGDTWDGEPCVSTPDSIYDDLTGWTAAQHGQDLTTDTIKLAKRDRFRRTGQSYG